MCPSAYIVEISSSALAPRSVHTSSAPTEVINPSSGTVLTRGEKSAKVIQSHHHSSCITLNLSGYAIAGGEDLQQFTATHPALAQMCFSLDEIALTVLRMFQVWTVDRAGPLLEQHQFSPIASVSPSIHLRAHVRLTFHGQPGMTLAHSFGCASTNE